MNPAFAIDYCRIVAPERLPDRFLSSGVFTPDQEMTSPVYLSFVFEIAQPWFPSSKVLSTLLETLQEGYHDLRAGKDLGDQFEDLLKAINQQLNIISEQGETDWIGNLNGLIMVIGDNELHFSQTGHCPAYLLQKNRIRQITDDIPQDKEPHPLKTFSNLASGTVQTDDYLLISNGELYNEISLDALRRIMSNNSPSQSCTSIVRELKKERNMAVASIILNVTTKEALAAKQPEFTEIILEDEMQSVWRKVQKKSAPWIELAKTHSIKAGQAGARAALKTGSYVKGTVAPAAASALKKGAGEAAKLKSQIDEKRTQAKKESSPLVEIIRPTGYIEPETIESESLPIGSKTVKADQQDPKPVPALQPVKPLAERKNKQPIQLPNFSIPSIPTIREWINQPRNKKIVALSMAGLLIAVTAFSIFSRKPHENTTETNKTEETLAAIEALQQKAATAESLSQHVEAAREIKDAQSQLATLTDLSASQNEKADALWQKLASQSDALTKATRFSKAVATYSFSESSPHFFASLPYFYGSNTANGSLLRTGQGAEASTQHSFDLPTANDSIIALTKSLQDDTTGYALTKNSQVFRITQNSTATSLQAISPSEGTFAPGDAISSYNGNLYILDGKNGLIWKYGFTGTSYNKGVSMIDSTKFDLKKGLSMAIDGSIYILKQDGTVMRFTSGKNDNFTLKNVPELAQTIVQPVQIITNEDIPNIYVLDGGTSTASRSDARILEFTKDGTYVSSYTFPMDLLQIQGFDIDPQQNKLWVISGSTISEFNI